MNKVVSIVVTFNRLGVLKKNLSYVKDQKEKPDFILIVNNGSDDGTKLYLDSLNPEYSSLHLSENLGYGAGLAEGIVYATKKWNPQYFWLMDDDSFPNPKVLSSLYFKAEEIHLDGILGLAGFKLKNGIPRPVSQEIGIQKADFVLVDNALLSRTAIEKVGNFRTDLFMMCEDYELCFRLKKHDLFVGVLNNDMVNVDRQHLGSQLNSTSLIWRGYYHSRNLFLILMDNFSWRSFFFYFHRQGKYLIHSAMFGKNKWLRTKLRFLGFLDGLRGVTGKTLDPITLKRISKI